MKYDPKDASNCLPEGEYPATLEKLVDTDDQGNPLTSRKTGYPMEYIVWRVYPPEGSERVLRQYITQNTAAWRYSEISKAAGEKAVAEFKAGTFDPSNYVGENFTLALSKQDGPNGEQNNIDKVLASSLGAAKPKASGAKQAQKTAAAGGAMSPDDIPF